MFRSHVDIEKCVSCVDEATIRRHVETIVATGPRAPRDLAARKKTTDYLAATLREYGYSVTEEPLEGRSSRFNLVAELSGTAKQGRVIELGAHYDTVPGSPGADDNTSGLAGVLEAARVLASAKPRHMIRFCLFDGEEDGLLGSNSHAARVAADKKQHIEGVVIFEMIGYTSREPDSQRTPIPRIPIVFSPPRTGDFIAAITNMPSRSLIARFRRAARRYAPGVKIYPAWWVGSVLPDASRSDHLPYWKRGRKAMMLTDTANFRNSNYHQPTDTPDTLDYGFITDIVRATVGMLLHWTR